MTQQATTETDLVAQAKETFHAAQAGDIAPALATWHPDILWHNDEAAGPWAGEFRGHDAVVTMFVEFTTLFGGTFRQELIDVAASDDHVVMLLRELGEIGPHRFDNRAVYVSKVVDGVTVELFTLDRDRGAARSFWEAVGPVAGPSRRA
ncbi:MAG TPA: nuclear transport factor 2 family protein [Acidimicrobiales bacterium]|nr:nuclear transport factor 2 family protein [Acidimicrobiales bacterium]